MALTSPPAQKCPPAPVSTTARMPASSRMPAMAAPKAWRIARSSALRASGRCMVSTAVAPMRSICSVSFISSSLLQQSWPPARRGSTAGRVCVAGGAGGGGHRGPGRGRRPATPPPPGGRGGGGGEGGGGGGGVEGGGRVGRGPRSHRFKRNFPRSSIRLSPQRARQREPFGTLVGNELAERLRRAGQGPGADVAQFFQQFGLLERL